MMSTFHGLAAILTVTVLSCGHQPMRASDSPRPSVAQAECRGHGDSVRPADEADSTAKVNIEGAIAMYAQALVVDPKNHEIHAKLGRAYEKKEDWHAMAETFGRATTLAPYFASYWHKQGFAFLMLAHGGEPGAYELAARAFDTCVQKDPNLAECHFLLGEAREYSGSNQSALESYTRAIVHDPTKGAFYLSLAALYWSLGQLDDAKAVISEGMRLVPSNEKNDSTLFRMYSLLADIGRLKGEKSAQLASIESAVHYEESTVQDHPEFLFDLGIICADMDPPQRDKAIHFLTAFTKRCREGGAQMMRFTEQCEDTYEVLQKLGP